MINCENICDQLIEKKNFLNICAAVLSHSVMSDCLRGSQTYMMQTT